MKKIKLCLLISFVCLSLVQFNCSSRKNSSVNSADGTAIKYYTCGSGDPALVFVHGYASSHADWNFQTNYFSKKHKVVTLDLAGFGESGQKRKNWTMEAFGEDAAAVIRRLNLDKVIIVGQSMGAVVVLEAVTRIPDRVIGIVPVDMFQNVEAKRTKEQNEEFEKRVWHNINNPDPEKLRAAFKRDINQKILDEMIHFYKTSSKTGWRESGRALFSWMSNNLPDFLKRIHVPVYCINSDQRATNLEIARKYAPEFNAKIIKNTGHAVMIDAPDDFNRALEEIIEEFLDKQ